MVEVIFLNNWGDSVDKLTGRMIYQTKNHDGIWNDLKFTKNIDEADYLIIMEGYKDSRKHPKDKKIYLQREPDAIVVEHQFNNDVSLFKGDYENFYHVSTWMIREKFSDIEKFKISKTKKLSFVTSSKKYTKAQVKRVEIADKLARLKVCDLYGDRFTKLNHNQYCKKHGLLDYRYSIAIENSSYANYFTEKIIDCFLCWSKPLYWGCLNIDKYFPKDSYALIDIYSDNVIEQIRAEIEKPINYDAIKEARNLVLYKYNIWPSIERIIKS